MPGYPAPSRPMDAWRLVDFTRELGLHVVQIADNLPLHLLSATHQEELRSYAEAHGVVVEVGTRGIQGETLRNYLQIAQRFNSPILRVVVDSANHHPSPQEVAEILRPMLPEFEAAGVVLAIENHDRFKAQQLADLIDSLNHPNLGVCLDTVNSFGSLEGPEHVVHTLAPYVVNLHVKEFSISRVDHNMGFIITGAPAGQGALDIPWLLAELDAHNRDYHAIIETWLPPLENMDETGQKERNWVRQSVQFMRQHIQD